MQRVLIDSYSYCRGSSFSRGIKLTDLSVLQIESRHAARVSRPQSLLMRLYARVWRIRPHACIGYKAKRVSQ